LIAWILSLLSNPLARKVVFYCVAIAAICLSLRWYGNRQWQKGEIRGRQTMAREIERQKRAEWEARERDLEAAAAGIAADKRSLAAATGQIARDRAGLSRSLNDALAQIRAERMRHYADAAATPDDRVWDDIRTISRELAAHP
jgi:hypothetical protein